MSSTSAVASALAHAFLAAPEWTRGSLFDAGARVVGARREFLGATADAVLDAFRRPPLDSPRELARFIGSVAAFTEAADAAWSAGTPLRVIRLPVSDSPAHSPTPAIPDLAALAALLELTDGELDWFADTKLWNRRARPGRLHHYRYEWRSRPGRVPRLLEAPGDRLKAIQRRVLDDVLTAIPLHDAAHGFVPGRSAMTGAAQHTGAKVVISLDLIAFFPSVTARRIYGTLRRAGLPESVAHSITGIATHSVPPWAIGRMPPGGSIDERFALRRALAEPHLPQGAPTSPTLANLAVRRLDSRLAGWADAAGARYTRYADDVAFSGGRELARRADAFVRGAIRIVEDQGYAANPRKTRVRGASVRQVVTGIVVNDRVNLARPDFDRLKAIIHNCLVHGPAGQNRDGHEDFRAHLLGRISWVATLNPARGERLLAEFSRIRW